MTYCVVYQYLAILINLRFILTHSSVLIENSAQSDISILHGISDTSMTFHQPRLSKSKIMSGLQCHKRLWLETYQRELINYTQASHAAFAQGNHFGELARHLITHTEQQASHLVATTEDPQQALQDTAIALNNYPILFEPAFRYEGVLVRIDALIRKDNGIHEPTYTVVEVKAASNIKPQYIRDSAIQVWVLRNIGLNINRVELGYINTEWVYKGTDYNGLLKRKDITDSVEKELPSIQKWVEEMRTILRQSNPPNIATGLHCNSPYSCPFLQYCSQNTNQNSLINANHTPQFSINLLPGVKGKTLAKRLQILGYTDLLTVPVEQIEGFEFVQTAYRSGQAWHNIELAKNSLLIHPKPWAYLDFETLSPAVPLWAGMKPFSHWPFQWSVHIEMESSALNPIDEIKTDSPLPTHYIHHEFLDLSGNNPSINCAKQLLSALKSVNTIWAYNAEFERQVIMRLATYLPEYANDLHQLANKIHDLIPIVQSCYYHPNMQGSYSLKSVLPAIAPELNYQNLTGVNNGNAAQIAFFEAISQSCTESRKAELQSQLQAYCYLDTWAMVVLVNRLLNPK